MTAEEAMTLIETAVGPRALFGRDAGRDYRRLARLTHPNANPSSPRAVAAFARLAALWRQHSTAGTPGRLAFTGDIASLYEHQRGLINVARDPADNDLMDREATALRRLRATGDARFRPYIPALAECQRHRDPDTARNEEPTCSAASTGS
jgi:hypothetical protein